MNILDEKEINFMEWGIINEYNFSDKKIYEIPVKVFDEIHTYNLVGKYSLISPVRRKRYNGIKDFSSKFNGEDYDIFISIDGKPYHDPLSTLPKKEKLDNSKVITFINRFPPMVRIISKDIEKWVRKKLKRMFDNYEIAYGICTVTCPKRIVKDIVEMNVDELTLMLYDMKNTIDVCKKKAKEVEKKVSIYPFFNIGKKAGASIEHLHSQIYFDLSEYGNGIYFDNLFKSFKKECPLCKKLKNIVYENKDFIVYVPKAMMRDTHLRVVPKKHIEGFEYLSEDEIKNLADSLLKTTTAIYKAYDIVEKNILFITKPDFYKGNFHFFIDILPAEFNGGMEKIEVMNISTTNVKEFVKNIRNKTN